MRGTTHTRPAHQLRRGVEPRLTKSRQRIKMLRGRLYKAEETGGERLKDGRAVQYNGRSVRKNSATSKGDRNNHNARIKRKKGVEEQCNQQRRPKQPQHKMPMRKACGRTVQPTKATETTTTQNNKGRSVRKNSATNKGDRNNHNAKIKTKETCGRTVQPTKATETTARRKEVTVSSDKRADKGEGQCTAKQQCYDKNTPR